MKLSNLSDVEFTYAELSYIEDMKMDEERIKKLFDSRKTGEIVRKFLQEELSRQVAEQMFEFVKGLNERDIRIYHLMAQVDSMEKSIKDTNKKITAIRNQLRKEKGREKLS